METDITGRGASARVTGAYLGHGSQHLDFDTTQEHAAPDTTSDLAFRGILRDRATAVWSGMIRVDPGAQHTDAFQESRNLILSHGAHADAIPGLEIEANDVRCTHAATVGRIDAEQVFYLMSRGLPRDEAERLLVGGFLGVVSGRLENSPLLHSAVSAALERELEAALA
jgi:Fe-S cluster assembly protein SufD